MANQASTNVKVLERGVTRAPKPTGVKLQLSKQPHAVEYRPQVVKFRQQKRIHRRKEIPEIPFGEVIGDAIPTDPLALDAQALASPSDAQLPLYFRNIDLDDVATADTASHVCEPSCAMNGDVLFVTGN